MAWAGLGYGWGRACWWGFLEGIALSMPRQGGRVSRHGSDGALPSSRLFCDTGGTSGGRKHPVHQPIVERFNEPAIVFLTVCTKDRIRVLARSDVTALLMDSWQDATSWLVGRFIVMPDHVYLFCAPGEPPARALKQWVRYWKTLASRRWPRRNEQPVWQLDFWDTQIRSVAHYDEKWEYVRQNPVRAGLVADSDEWPHQGELNELRW
jgi:putative transposase